MFSRFVGLTGFRSTGIISRGTFARINTINSIARRNFSRSTVRLQESVSAAKPQLKWNEFLKLRKQERRINMVSSIFTAWIGASVGLAYVSQLEMDLSFQIYGFDPILVMCVALISCGALGFLSGPLVGSTLFKAKNKGVLKLYEQKNSTFLKHIIKNRVDASRQSFSNPVPDFYGEKITSLKDYKQWLRDCNAYRRKTTDFI